jgi:hypothetical protein
VVVPELLECLAHADVESGTGELFAVHPGLVELQGDAIDG